MNINKNQRLLLSVISAFLLSFLIEMYVLSVETQLNIGNLIETFFFKRYIMFFILTFILFRILYDDNLREKVFDFIYKYRYPLSVIVIAVCVIFQIHGSSISELNIFGVNHNPLFGISRFMRSDEYLVNTLFAFSQYPNHFSYFSEIVRAAPTDMFIVYGQAILDIAVIFRPFNIGYLFLNPGMGLSFFWVARFVVLALISFETGMLITNKNRALSLSYAFLITLSPLVQWWFAINGLVEQLIFGQLGVLLINFYMNTTDFAKRILSALGMIICIGGFLIVFYPSWQIPFAYVFVLLGIWIFLKNRKNFSYDKKDILIIFTSFLIFAAIMAHILNNSMDTIKILLNTAYPGGEVFNGDGTWNYLFNYIASTYFPLTSVNIPVNTVENSVFIDFFPIPLIVSLIVLVKQKTKDKLLIGLVALYLLFLVFFFVQLPDSIISITLRNHIKTSRLFSVVTFISVLILIRSLASLKEFADKKLIIIFSVILSIIVVYLSTFFYSDYYLTWMIICSVIICSIAFSLILMAHDRKGKMALLIGIVFITFTAGALVNPIDHGTDVVFENNFTHEVKNIVDQDPDAKWLVQDIPSNYFITVGAKTINSVHTYPDIEKWQQLDSNGTYKDIYNRYSHIKVDFNNNTNTTFTLLSPDLISINLTVNDLEKLNVSYISTPKNLEALNSNNVTFNKVYSMEPYKIYKVSYK